VTTQPVLAGAPPQSKGPGSSAQRQQRREQIAAMRKEHMEAAKAQLQKLHSDLDQMKGNVNKITDAGEKARWQANVDMWQIMVNHLDQMMQHMEGMPESGMPGGMMMRHHGPGDRGPGQQQPPPPPPKPE
jgi:hypothetical protein